MCKLLPRFLDSICLPLLRTLAGAAAFQKRYIRTCMQCMCECIFSNRFALATRKCAYWVPQLIPCRVSFQGLAKFLHSFLAELLKLSCRLLAGLTRILQESCILQGFWVLSCMILQNVLQESCTVLPTRFCYLQALARLLIKILQSGRH